ncbi:hypothetical protein CU044_6629 [Streptomyces sp. L-9-10]|nr:hypothetical protein CU044_6629 [Streptomyces sp. L-9-10]
MCADSRDAHGSCPSSVRYFVTRSKSWRDGIQALRGCQWGVRRLAFVRDSGRWPKYRTRGVGERSWDGWSPR